MKKPIMLAFYEDLAASGTLKPTGAYGYQGPE
jgi:hypothetical protein